MKTRGERKYFTLCSQICVGAVHIPGNSKEFPVAGQNAYEILHVISCHLEINTVKTLLQKQKITTTEHPLISTTINNMPD